MHFSSGHEELMSLLGNGNIIIPHGKKQMSTDMLLSFNKIELRLCSGIPHIGGNVYHRTLSARQSPWCCSKVAPYSAHSRFSHSRGRHPPSGSLPRTALDRQRSFFVGVVCVTTAACRCGGVPCERAASALRATRRALLTPLVATPY